MRRILACVLLGGFLVAVVLPPQAFAQQDEAAQREAEFSRLYERWQQSRDPEERVALGERLLALESTLKDRPQQVGRDQVKGEVRFDLGHNYARRTAGHRPDNLEKSIAAFEAALQIFTRAASPREWALTQYNLGFAYGDRIRGDRADNLEKAIAAYEAALQIFTRETSPREWAQAQYNLGHASGDRIRGDRADNVAKAIAAYEAALQIFTREASPRDWSRTQSKLGLA